MTKAKRLYRPSDINQNLALVVAQTQARLSGNIMLAPIAADTTFRKWCEGLAQERVDPRTGETLPGLLVDGKPFTLDNRPAMAWLYDQIPSTQEEAWRRTLVLMKCTQVGFTVMEMLATIYLGLKFPPCTVGMFLPDMGLAEGKSTEVLCRLCERSLRPTSS